MLKIKWGYSILKHSDVGILCWHYGYLDLSIVTVLNTSTWEVLGLNPSWDTG
jgi:hypothetical protein